MVGALPTQRLASDARNLVRDWFRRQMPQQRFVDADLQKADQITLWQYAAHRKGAARTRQVVARWAKRPFGRKPGRTCGLGCWEPFEALARDFVAHQPAFGGER